MLPEERKGQLSGIYGKTGAHSFKGGSVEVFGAEASGEGLLSEATGIAGIR